MTKRLLTIRFSKNRFFTLLAAGFLTAGAQAQTFAPYVNNPFSLSSPDWQRKPTLIDIDADGDLDLFMGSTPYADVCHLVYFQNTGTAAAPVFAAGVADPFGFGLIGNGMAQPAFVDLDNDGDYDLMIGDQNGTSRYYTNTGTATACQFSTANSTVNPFGLGDVGFWATPAFADLDNDGDKDLLLGEYYGDLYYFRNTGTAAAPVFTSSALPAGINNSGLSPKPVFRDIDNDGDQDLFVGVDNARHVYSGIRERLPHRHLRLRLTTRLG